MDQILTQVELSGSDETSQFTRRTPTAHLLLQRIEEGLKQLVTPIPQRLPTCPSTARVAS